MGVLKIYSVSDKYIDFLFNDPELQRFILDNKKNRRKHTRKYLGTVLNINGLSYFIPFSSPKPTDYIINSDQTKTIRRSTLTIIRMTCKNSTTGAVELKGTLKINNMIPVPPQELTYYDISSETDISYKDLLQKEYAFIKSHRDEILKNAAIVYSQKSKKEQIEAKAFDSLSDEERRILIESPKYLNATVPFSYAEEQCLRFLKDFVVT